MDVWFSRRRFYDVVTLCLLQVVIGDGFPGLSFSASLPAKLNFTSPDEVIRSWEQITATNGIAVSSNQGFLALTFGIYLVGYVINVNIGNPQAIKACIQLNEDSPCQALVSQFNSSSTTIKQISLHASGVLKLYSGDFVSVRMLSNKKWTSLGGSVFFGQLIHEYASFPSFYISPSTSFAMSKGVNHFINSWNVGKHQGSFKSTSSISLYHGLFSVTRSGFYFISANIVFKKEPGSERYCVIAMKGDREVEEAVMATSVSTTVIVLSVNTILKLEAGSKITVRLGKRGDVNTRILDESSFSISLMKEGFENALGLRAETIYQRQYEKGEVSLNLVDFRTTSFNPMEKATLVASREGSYILCYNFRLFCIHARSCNINLKLERNLRNNIIPIAKQTIDIDGEMTVSNSILLNLLKNDEIHIKIAGDSPYWYLDVKSTINFLRVEEIYPALSVSLPTAVKKTSNSWVKIQNFQLNQHGGFSFTADAKRGDYLIHRAGIYHVTANIIVSNLKNAMASASVTINDDVTQTDGLTTLNSDANGKCTLSIASAVFLKKGNRVSVYLKVSGFDIWEIGQHSAFSLVYIGRPSLVTGFQTTLFSDVSQTSTGWNTPSDWDRPKDVTSMPYSFQSNAKLSQFGAFRVPTAGLYFVAANIIVGHADLLPNDSLFIGMISINWRTDATVLYAMKTRKLQPTQNDVRRDIAFSTSAVVRLNKGDNVAVKVCSKSDPFWIIRKATGFSAVLLSSSGLSNGFLALRDSVSTNISDAKDGLINSRWKTNMTNSLLFTSGSSIRVLDDTLKIYQDGIYFISIMFHISLNSPQVIAIGLIHDRTKRRIICSENTQRHPSSYVSCYSTLFLKAESSFKIFLRKDPSQGKISIGNDCFVSAFRIERPKSYPWFYAELIKNQNATGISTNASWTTFVTSRLAGRSGFAIDKVNRVFPPVVSGYFLITSNVVFLSTSKGTQLLGTETLSADSGSTASVVRFTTKRSIISTISAARLLPITKFGFRQTLQISAGSEMDRRSSVSAAFLPKLSGEDIVELSVLTTQKFSRPGFAYITDVGYLSRGKPKNYTTEPNSLYIISSLMFAKFSPSQIRMRIGLTPDNQLPWIHQQTSTHFSTYSSTAIFKSTTSGVLSIGLELEKDKFFRISKRSRLYAAKLGSIFETVGVISSLQKGPPAMDGKQSFNLWSLIAVSTSFVNKVIVKDGLLVIKRSGVYVVTLAVTIATHQKSIYKAYVRIDGSLANSLYTMQEIESSGTLSVVNSLYFERGVVLDVILAAAVSSFEVLSMSNVAAVLLEDLDENINDAMPPVIYKDILPVAKRLLPVGHPITVSCYAFADERIVYRWFLNGQLISSSMDNRLRLVGKSLESGEYHCEAVASLVTTVSKSVIIAFLGSEDCVKLVDTCKPGNQTCFHSSESYKCQCKDGSETINGKCPKSSNKTPENGGLLGESLDIPVEAIVIAPICIIVVLFLISLAVYTHCKSSATTGRGEIPSSSSETEQVQLNGLNEVAFHPILRSDDEQTSNENALQDGLMRNNELKEEGFRDTGDRSFFSMSTL